MKRKESSSTGIKLPNRTHGDGKSMLLRKILPSARGKKLLALIWLAAGSLAVVAAQGQVMVQNGQALDASNQVGSGGSNATIPGYVPFNGNQYMQNNNSTARQSYQVVPVPLPGGGVTYARVPMITSASPSYSSPPGALPMNNYSSGPLPSSGAKINGAVNGMYSPSALGITGQNGLGQTNAYYGGSSVPYNGPVPVGPASPFASIYGNPASPITSSTIGLAQNGLVGPTGVSGSNVNSLFGLREIPMQQQVGYERLTGASNQKSNTSALIPAQQQQNDQTKSVPGNGAGLQSGGSPLSGVVNATRIGKPLGTPENGLVTQNSLPGARGTGDVYQDLLQELRTGKKMNIVAPGLPGQPAMTLDNLAPQSSTAREMVQIDPITGLPILNAQSHVLKPAKTGNPSHAGTKAVGAARFWSDANQLTIPSKVEQELQAGRHVAALQSLAGTMADQFDRNMAYGQKLLNRGKYMQAIQAFQGALTMRPNNPLAIIGQVHAEIAAGLYGSAAYNLQFIYNRNPALTAVRYNLKKLLPSASLHSALRDLRRLVGHDNSSAAMLLAYLDYQLHYRSHLRQVLTEWSDFDAKSIWPEILRKAWIEKASSDGANMKDSTH